jgi:hypothetical protein
MSAHHECVLLSQAEREIDVTDGEGFRTIYRTYDNISVPPRGVTDVVITGQVCHLVRPLLACMTNYSNVIDAGTTRTSMGPVQVCGSRSALGWFRGAAEGVGRSLPLANDACTLLIVPLQEDPLMLARMIFKGYGTRFALPF